MGEVLRNPTTLVCLAVTCFILGVSIGIGFIIKSTNNSSSSTGTQQSQTPTQLQEENNSENVSTDQFEHGGHPFGWTKTGTAINQTLGKCTTNKQQLADAYPELRYESSDRNRAKRATSLQYDRQARIVGGGRTNVREFPWVVSLQVQGTHVCGGSIILDKWVVTAAHCTNVYDLPTDWEVLAGVSSSKDYSYNSQQSKVDKIIQHPDFNQQTYDHDIALLLVHTKLRYNDRVQPVCIPDPVNHIFATATLDIDDTELDCYVAGYGAIWAGGTRW